LKVVPLNGSHVRGAVNLHRAAGARCYRGPASPAVLRAFYDAYANRDGAVGTAALAAGDVAAVICGALTAGGPAAWLSRRRRWRALRARLAAGPDLARGGWPVEVLRAAAAGDVNEAFVVSFAAAAEVAAGDIVTLFETFAAAAASHGNGVLAALCEEKTELFEAAGFDYVGEAEPPGNVSAHLYRRYL
jgi:hypothetical protein